RRTTIDLQNSIAQAMLGLDQSPAAEALARKTLQLARDVCGEKSDEVGKAMSTLANALQNQGNFQQAEPIFRDVVARLADRPTDDNLIWSLNSLGGVLDDQGKYQEAEKVLRESVDRANKNFGDHDLVRALSTAKLGRVIMQQNRDREAEPILRNAL